MSASPHERSATGRWDPIIRQLQDLRLRSGDPSYGLIAEHITERRLSDGASEHAARIARSTVYDAFRLGRSRVNVDLLREIVQAMGHDPAVIDGWLAAAPDAPSAPPGEALTESDTAEGLTLRQVLILAAGLLALNLLGRLVVDLLNLPIYLDMVGTAAAAVILGPWRGAAVGALTSIVGVLLSGEVSLYFTHVEVAGALLWGYGVRHARFRCSLSGFFSLCALVGLLCSALAIPVLYLLLPDGTASGATFTISNISDLLGSRLVGTAIGNVTTSLIDKLLTGFAVLALLAALPSFVRRSSPLRTMPGLQG